LCIRGLIRWAMEQQLRFIKEEEIEEFGRAFLKNVDKELGIDDIEPTNEPKKNIGSSKSGGKANE